MLSLVGFDLEYLCLSDPRANLRFLVVKPLVCYDKHDCTAGATLLLDHPLRDISTYNNVRYDV